MMLVTTETAGRIASKMNKVKTVATAATFIAWIIYLLILLRFTVPEFAVDEDNSTATCWDWSMSPTYMGVLCPYVFLFAAVMTSLFTLVFQISNHIYECLPGYHTRRWHICLRYLARLYPLVMHMVSLALATFFLASILVDNSRPTLIPELTGNLGEGEKTAWFTVMCVGLFMTFVALLLSGRTTFQGRRLTFIEDPSDEDLFFYRGLDTRRETHSSFIRDDPSVST